MSDFGLLWRKFGKRMLGRVLVAMVVGAVLVLKATDDGKVSMTNGALLGALLGLVAVIPLEVLGWRQRKKADESVQLSGCAGWLLILYILIAIIAFGLYFL